MADDKEVGQEGGKEGKKGSAPRKSKKKISDPFTKKDWYDIKAPDLFLNRKVGKMPVTKSQGQVLAEDSLKGRIVEVNLADLQKDEDQSHRKILLRVEEVQGKYCLTNFYGMDFTTDKLRSLVRKWQTLIEAATDVKTTDGYLLRLFCIGFTKRRPNQQKKTCYAQGSQIHAIRQKMNEIIRREASSVTLRELVLKFLPEAIGGMIQKETNGIFPLQHVFIRRVKLLSSPKFDPQALRELHDKTELAKMEADDAGEAVKAEAAAAEKKEEEKKAEAEKKGADAGKKGGQKGGDKKGADAGKKGGDKKPADKPAEKKPAEKKPAEKKPADKPAEKKPAEKKPAEKKPADKPADKKGGEKKGS